MDAHYGGSIKFDHIVSLERLQSLMLEFKENFKGKWIDLHVRRSGKDGSHYIAFRYDISSSDENLHKKFDEELIDYLCKELGVSRLNRPQGVDGWSMSTIRASGI